MFELFFHQCQSLVTLFQLVKGCLALTKILSRICIEGEGYSHIKLLGQKRISFTPPLSTQKYSNKQKMIIIENNDI